jgi:Tfp pilus assembly protein PilN
VAATGSVSTAQSSLDTATAQHASLQAETAKYSQVTAIYGQAAAAQAMLTQAMGEEVRYSQFMNDLTLTVPESVWLKNLTFTQAGSGAAPAASAPAAAVSTPGIGTVTFTGIGFSHDDVAVWLESLASQKGYADPYFTNSTEALLGTRKIVNFTSTATLTPAAYSGRYTKPAGG